MESVVAGAYPASLNLQYSIVFLHYVRLGVLLRAMQAQEAQKYFVFRCGAERYACSRIPWLLAWRLEVYLPKLCLKLFLEHYMWPQIFRAV